MSTSEEEIQAIIAALHYSGMDEAQIAEFVSEAVYDYFDQLRNNLR